MSTIKHHQNVAAMKSVHAHLSIGDSEWDLIEESLPPPPIPRPSIQELRAQSAHFAKIRAEKSLAPKTGLIITERTIPANGTEISIRTYIPESSDSNRLFPLLCFMHGGGYALGNLDSADDMCRMLCVKLSISIVNIDYRLAPEFPFPYGVMDSFDAVKWSITNAATELKADLKLGFIVGGTSSGANYATAITFLAQDDDLFKTYPITGQALQIPTVCAQEAYPEKYKSELSSRWDLLDAPFLNDEAINQFRTNYVPPTGPTPFDIRISQIIAPSHKGLPPAHFQIAGKDPLRDEGLFYEKLLRESGVPTKLDIYPGVPHGFASFMPQLKASQKYRDELEVGVKWLLDLGKQL